MDPNPALVLYISESLPSYIRMAQVIWRKKTDSLLQKQEQWHMWIPSAAEW